MADNMDIFMHAERIQESDNDYAATNASGHFGAYQFDISTWIYALNLAGLQYLVFAGTLPSLAPPSVQDAAARALMSKYYGEFGNSFYSVAEAWYGGPGAVGHPDWGGGPGEPTVGEYASQVIAKYVALGGTNGGGPAAPSPGGGYTAATLLELLLALNQEATQRSLGDQHSREQAIAGLATEAVQRSIGDDHTRQQTAAAFAVEAAARSAGDQHSREQAAALVLAESQQRAAGDADTRQQAAAALKALYDTLNAQVHQVLTYAQSIPGLIDRAAVNGYDPTLPARGTEIQKLIDTVAAHDPVIAGLVGDLAKFAIDLAGVEDPVARIAATIVLKQVIDRLGLDSALKALVSDLLGSIIGGGQPRTLQDVTRDIGGRLNTLESAVSDLSPLTTEADQLHELGTLIFDGALLAYFAAVVADPVAAADDTVAVFAPVTGPLLGPVRALLGMG